MGQFSMRDRSGCARRQHSDVELTSFARSTAEARAWTAWRPAGAERTS